MSDRDRPPYRRRQPGAGPTAGARLLELVLVVVVIAAVGWLLGSALGII